jgi:hypothetical protein
VPKWAQARLEERPEIVRRPGPAEDGEGDPAPPAAAGTGRGLDVYLAIGGSDQPGAPYTLAVPAEGAGDTTTTTSSEPPPGADELAGWRWDLDALADADRSFGPLDQYPRDDQGVVRLPAVTVTAVPVTRPEQAGRAPVAADATPWALKDAAVSLVGEEAAGDAGPDADAVEVAGAQSPPTVPEDPVAGPHPAGVSAAGRIPAPPVGQRASGSTFAEGAGQLAPAIAWVQDGWRTLTTAGLLAGDVEASERPAEAAGAEPEAEPLTWVDDRYLLRQGVPTAFGDALSAQEPAELFSRISTLRFEYLELMTDPTVRRGPELTAVLEEIQREDERLWPRAYALMRGRSARLGMYFRDWWHWVFPPHLAPPWGESGGQLGPVEPLDPAKVLADNRVLFVADCHTCVDIHPALKELLPPLAQAGVTDLALETFPFGSDLRDLRAALKLIPTRFAALRVLDTIDQGHRLGLRVWGIGLPFAELAAEYVRPGVLRDPFAAIAKSNSVWSEHLLARLRADPDAKLVVLVGATHVGHYDAESLNTILAANGFPSAILHIHSEELRWEFPEKQWMRPLVRQYPEPFMVRESGWPRWFDYLASAGRTRPAPPPSVARVKELQARSRELWGRLHNVIKEADKLMAGRNPDPLKLRRLEAEGLALQAQRDATKQELRTALQRPAPGP